jgi:hypothetical protein
MKTPKEKAQELIEKYSVHCWINPIELMKEKTKQCALIAVEEILGLDKIGREEYRFYLEVKSEIEKL